ncbi:MAG: amidase [Deltaproteobacteria bacterium]|jgi:aspartyl-tRNA(Asn)/glutamyl-tRNA(Gln) amidotransferase subunit A|nr:amidase [Deltaproteobacteria bacterium]MBT6502205.1 amidase [Deltaproteobacteria bacterium]MBT6612293.1 amidase [Deltaproteobacteria bacterium]MBT7151234.1 amidase [Deltaproteobacteria bacterium]MBT7716652.1 amidase [Deltaproteobacteria bacterium]
MSTDELLYKPAVNIAAEIRSKKLSPVEVTEAVIERIEALNTQINAFCTPMFDIARDKARQAEAAQMRGEFWGPLHGVPYSIKDSTDYAGVRTTTGCVAFKDNIALDHSPSVKRLEAAGGIPLGKTVTPDMAWKGLTDSPLLGTTRNPWNLQYNPGGSSGGSAAAVATGMGPLATGTDGAGSIRIPASFTGVYGLKPSFGRVPITLPNVNQHTHEGPITRTVSDAALMLDLMCGPDDRDLYSLEGKDFGFLANLNTDIKGLKVGWSSTLGFSGRIDAEVIQTCEKAAMNFESLGCSIEETALDLSVSMEVAKRNWQAIMAALVLYKLPHAIDQMDPALVACAREAESRPVGAFLYDKIRAFEDYQKLTTYFTDFDLLLTPTVACLPIQNGRLLPEGYPDHDWDWMEWAPFSSPFNLFHNPAASVPAGFSANGLPIGLQIIGPRHCDLLVLQASMAYETAHPWAHIIPEIGIV